MNRLLGRLTLSQRLFVIGLIAVLPSCAALILNEVELRRQRLHEIQAEASHNAALALSEMKQIIAGARAVLEATSLTPVVSSPDLSGCDGYLRNVIKHVESIADIVVTDREGHTRCGTVHVDVSDRTYLQTALAQDRFVIGGFITGRASGRPRLPLTLPLHDSAGQITGAVITSLDLDWLGRQIKGRALAPGNALTVADRDGVILAREPYADRFVGTRIPDSFQHLVQGLAAGTVEITSQDGARRVLGYVPAPISGIDLYISVGIEAVDAYAAIENASLRAFGLVALGGIAALLLAWWFGRAQIRTPVRRILRTTERFTSGNFQARTRLQGREGEIEAIGEAFDRFADQLERREAERDEASRQRELLIQELNHRVKNVLTVVQSVATSTLRRDVAPDRLEDFEKRIAAIARSHELLTLSNWERADLRDIIKAVVIPVCGTDDERIRMSGPSFVMEPIPALSMSMLLHELCTNAVKYGALSVPDGSVVLTWDVRPDGTRHFSWREIGGPKVEAPTRRGFGSRLIAALGRRLSGTTVLTYAADGLVCDVELSPAADAPPVPEPERPLQHQE